MDLKFLSVTGKGGVGKTTIAAAIACAAAAQGKKVLLAEWSSQTQIGPLFGVSSVVHEEVQVARNVSLINLNPRNCFKEYVVDHLGLKSLYDKVFDHRLVKSFLEAMPGLAETMLLGRFYYSVVLAPRFDLIIFDAPASGHYLQLLTTPQAILGAGVVGPLVREVENIQNFLRAETSSSIYVCIPEPLVISETIDFVPKIQGKSPLKMSAVLLNRAAVAATDSLSPGQGEAAASHHKVLASYFEHKVQRESVATGLLHDAQKKELAGIDVLTAPELGAIEEPLSEMQAGQLLRGTGA